MKNPHGKLQRKLQGKLQRKQQGKLFDNYNGFLKETTEKMTAKTIRGKISKENIQRIPQRFGNNHQENHRKKTVM